MNEKTIVTTMVEQHRGLQKDLSLISNLLLEEQINFVKIINLLQKFIKDLEEHLKLENDTFYPQLLKEMKAQNQNTDKTEIFIAEMKDIEVVVTTFLEKYKDILDLEKNISEFKKEFPNIVETLNLRIESEEAGVYSYWGLF